MTVKWVVRVCVWTAEGGVWGQLVLGVKSC